VPIVHSLHGRAGGRGGEGDRGGRGGGTRGRGGDTYSRVLTVEEGHAGLEVTLAFDFCFRITNGWTESHIY